VYNSDDEEFVFTVCRLLEEAMELLAEVMPDADEMYQEEYELLRENVNLYL